MTTNATNVLNNRLTYLDPESRHFNLCWQATLFMLSLFIVTLILWSFDQRQLDNVSVWAKPLKFESSLTIYFITLALLATYLPVATRMRATWRWAVRFAVAAGVFEMVYILIQAARGRASHYNNDTNVEELMYAAMGIGAVLLVAVSFYLGWLLYREYRKDKNDIFKLAAAHGMMWGSVLTLVTAGTMSSGQTHFAGTPAIDSMRVPIVGWILSGGDLRIPHFFATHLMQVLPVYGLFLQRRKIRLDVAKKNVRYFLLVYCSLVLTGFSVCFLF